MAILSADKIILLPEKKQKKERKGKNLDPVRIFQKCIKTL